MLNLFQSTAVPALEQSAAFAQRRHEVLAGNLANIDTPGYRSRDLSVDQFQQALAESIQQATQPSPGHALDQQAQPDFADGPRQAMEQVVFHDGSDVALERQVTAMAKNQHLHNLAVALMRSQFSILRAAIAERA